MRMLPNGGLLIRQEQAQFCDYFLVPLCACHLIQEDQTVFFDVAYDIDSQVSCTRG